MVFTPSNRHPNTINVNLSIDNQLLQVVPTYKYLGVILDQYLSFEQHIKSIHEMVIFKTYQLARLRHFLTSKMALNNYKLLLYLILTMQTSFT